MQVLVVITHSKLCKLHHTQIHHGSNGMKCDFPTREVEISTSFFTVNYILTLESEFSIAIQSTVYTLAPFCGMTACSYAVKKEVEISHQNWCIYLVT